MPNKNVSVLVSPAMYRSTYTTNEHGLANIVIDTSNFVSSILSISVSRSGHVGLKRLKSRDYTIEGCVRGTWTPGMKENVLGNKTNRAKWERTTKARKFCVRSAML